MITRQHNLLMVLILLLVGCRHTTTDVPSARSPGELAQRFADSLLAGELDEAPRRFFPEFAEFRSVAPDASEADCRKYYQLFARDFAESCRDLGYYLEAANVPPQSITDVHVAIRGPIGKSADVLVSFLANGQRYGFLLDECREYNGVWYAMDIDWLGQNPE